MKILKLILSTLFITVLFTACTSSMQKNLVTSNKNDVSSLLEALIIKEKEINKLNQTLEDCKKK